MTRGYIGVNVSNFRLKAEGGFHKRRSMLINSDYWLLAPDFYHNNFHGKGSSSKKSSVLSRAINNVATMRIQSAF